jgi:hypothetical protein
MSIAERLAVQTIDGSEESMLDRVGGFHDRLPFFFRASGGRPITPPNIRSGGRRKTLQASIKKLAGTLRLSQAASR